MSQDSFYLTLPSTGSRGEYPNNNASDFKVRLPDPLHLRSGEWEVGLASMSMPNSSVHLPPFSSHGRFLFRMSWFKLDSTTNAETLDEAVYQQQELDYISDSNLDGIRFMSAVVNFFEQKRDYLPCE